MLKTVSFVNKPKVIMVKSVGGLIADFADDVVSKESNTLFLCAGNTGLGYGGRNLQDMELTYLEDTCKKNDNIVCIIRGCHDNPMYFNEETYKENFRGLYDYLQHVYFLEDLTCVKTSKGNILCIGGGVDPTQPEDVMYTDPMLAHKYGVATNTWFDTKIPLYDLRSQKETYKGEDGLDYEVETNDTRRWLLEQNFSIVLSFMPMGAIPGYPMSKLPEKIYDDAVHSQGVLSMIYSILKPQVKSWYFNNLESDFVCKDIQFEGATFIPLCTGYANHFGTKRIP